MCRHSYPHLYINLDRHTERRRDFERRHRDAMQVCVFERVPAVDGRLHFAPSEDALKRGEKGCIASHRQAWTHIHDAGKAFGVVLEDDAKLDDRYTAMSDTLMDEAAQVCARPLVFLDRTTWTDTSREPAVSDHLHRVTEPSHGTHAYALARETAEFLAAQEIDQPLDIYLHRFIGSDEVCLLRTSTSWAHVENPFSSTQET